MVALRTTAALAAAIALGGPALAQTAPGTAPNTATATINTMNTLWGRHPGQRANHAKGVVAQGSFVPTPAAAGLSMAPMFSGKPVPVVVRFSDSTGLPALADGDGGANPHGMSIRFQPEGAGYVDVVTNSLGFFPVATGEEFLELLQAVAASPAEAPKPTKLEQFIDTHPAVPKAFGSTSTPSSFARDTYNGVNAFVFVDAAGKRQPFRYKYVPVAGAEHLPASEAAKLSPDALVDELPQRIAAGPVAFQVMAQLANAGDQTKDSSQPWPDDRRMVDLGTITLTGVAADQAKASADLRFLPNHLSPGIEVSDDPLIDARVRSYLISFGRRGQ